jgi:hypothetical protein
MDWGKKAVEEQHKVTVGQCGEMYSEYNMLRRIGQCGFSGRDWFQAEQSQGVQQFGSGVSF